jgi:site-specific DNA recombinase
MTRPDKNVNVSNVVSNGELIDLLISLLPTKFESGMTEVDLRPLAELLGLDAWQVGAVYARYSTKRQDSVEDQVRECVAANLAKGILVRYVFADRGVSGRKSRRPGLRALIEAVETGKVQVVSVFMLSRLYRKTYRSAQFIQEEVTDRGYRFISVWQGIDTATTPQPSMLINSIGMADEHQVEGMSQHVRSAQLGYFLRKLPTGQLTFGYRTEPVPGWTTKLGRPLGPITIDDGQAETVRQVFTWFVRDGWTISGIAKHLNETDVPAPTSPRGRWSHQMVRTMLGNERYRGDWSFGKKKSVYLSKQDYVRGVPQDPDKITHRHDEALRIVDDDLWLAAQKRLEDGPRGKGKKRGSYVQNQPKDMLSGLMFCATCGRTLHTAGGHARYRQCPNARRGVGCTMRSMARNDLTKRLLCERLAELVSQDGELVDQIVSVAQHSVQSLQRPDPSRLKQLRQKEAAATRAIERLVDFIAKADKTDEELMARYERERRRRLEAQAEIAKIRESAKNPIQVPSREDILAHLRHLAETLVAAADGKLDEARQAEAIQLVRLLTGGRVEVEQVDRPGRKRGFLRGTFRAPIAAVVAERLTGVKPIDDGEGGEVTLDLTEHPKMDLLADEVKRLYDAGWTWHAMAGELGMTVGGLYPALMRWYEMRGLPKPKLGRPMGRWGAKSNTDGRASA